MYILSADWPKVPLSPAPFVGNYFAPARSQWYDLSMALPPAQYQDAETLLAEFCQRHSPPEHADKYKMTFLIKNPYITLYENRPSIANKKKWTSVPIARIRFDPSELTWELYWLDQNSKGHVYDRLEPTVDLGHVLAEIERDETHIFFG
jgi:hypothetical protein